MSERPEIGKVLEHYYDVVVPTGFHGRAKMHCPDPGHNDARASASVDHVKNRVKCFSCDFGGDSFDIIMEQEGCDFKTAVQVAESRFDYAGSEVSGAATGLGGGDGVPGWSGIDRENNRRRRTRLRRRRR